MKQVSASELNVLKGVAISADIVQFGLTPLQFLGIGEIINVAMDIALFGLFTWRLGFHVAFLPSIVTEFIPVIDLIPAWTMAIFFVTRNNDTPQNVPSMQAPQHIPPSEPFIKDIKTVDVPVEVRPAGSPRNAFGE